MRLRNLPLAALALGCSSDGIGPSDDAAFRGVITSRQSSFYGVQTPDGVELRSIPQMLVSDANGASEHGCPRASYFLFDASTPVTSGSGAKADTGALVIGQRVSVWATGSVMQSCPPITSAERIVIEDVPLSRLPPIPAGFLP